MTNEWENEPDRVEFEAHAFECIINRSPMGALCGYIAIPKGHPYYGIDEKSYDLSVHGGVTFSEERDGKWWIGFDCAHSCDIIPRLPMLSLNNGSQTYKNIEYVKKELVNLAVQLKEKYNERRHLHRSRNGSLV